jgi:hypothetical protein
MESPASENVMPPPIQRQGAIRERFNWADEAEEMEIEHTMSFGYVDPEPSGGWTEVRGRRAARRAHVVEENEVLVPITNRYKPIAPHRQSASSPTYRQSGFMLPPERCQTNQPLSRQQPN